MDFRLIHDHVWLLIKVSVMIKYFFSMLFDTSLWLINRINCNELQQKSQLLPSFRYGETVFLLQFQSSPIVNIVHNDECNDPLRGFRPTLLIT